MVRRVHIFVCLVCGFILLSYQNCGKFETSESLPSLGDSGSPIGEDGNGNHDGGGSGDGSGQQCTVSSTDDIGELVQGKLSSNEFGTSSIGNTYHWETFNLGNSVKVQLPKTGLTPEEVGLIIQQNKQSIRQIGEYYQQARNIPNANVIYMDFNSSSLGNNTEIENFRTQLRNQLPSSVKAIVVVADLIGSGTGHLWALPKASWRIAYGTNYTPYISPMCGEYFESPFFQSDSVSPVEDHDMWLVGFLRFVGSYEFNTMFGPVYTGPADNPFDATKPYIDKSVSSDSSFPPGKAYFHITLDRYRNIRTSTMRSTQNKLAYSGGLSTAFLDANENRQYKDLENKHDVLFHFTGDNVLSGSAMASCTYKPGSIADNVDSNSGKSFNLIRIAGVSAMYGTTSEPCADQRKFTRPDILVPSYFRGATALESVWRSVRSFAQGAVYGDVLARPFKPKVTLSGSTISIKTTLLEPGAIYELREAVSESGPFVTVKGNISTPDYGSEFYSIKPVTISYSPAKAGRIYRLFKASPESPYSVRLISPSRPTGTQPDIRIEVKTTSFVNKFHVYSDSNCTNKLASKDQSGTFSQIDISLPQVGLYNFNARVEKNGVLSKCSTASAYYNYTEETCGSGGGDVFDGNKSGGKGLETEKGEKESCETPVVEIPLQYSFNQGSIIFSWSNLEGTEKFQILKNDTLATQTLALSYSDIFNSGDRYQVLALNAESKVIGKSKVFQLNCQ